MRGLVVLAITGGLAACLNTAPQPKLDYDTELLDGHILFAETVPAAPQRDLIGVSPAMAEFVDLSITRPSNGYMRFRHLMRKLERNGYFVDQYRPDATYTAAQAFDTRKGNCLAYTNLFVALAREAGLVAKFQLVKSNPSWDVESGYLVRNNHINVTLQRVNMPGSPDSKITVDFNLVQAAGDARTEIISDGHAASLYYANIGIDHLHRENYRDAFANFKRAILEEPNNIDAWNNLAVLYSVLGRFAHAERTYQTALSLDANDKTAISGMAKSLLQQGREQQAQEYADLAKKYRLKNAFYHYALAKQAFQSESYEAAIVAVNDAIRLKRKVSRFYGLRANAASKLGDQVLAEESVRLWRKYREREKNPPRRIRTDRGSLMGVDLWVEGRDGRF